MTARCKKMATWRERRAAGEGGQGQDLEPTGHWITMVLLDHHTCCQGQIVIDNH